MSTYLNSNRIIAVKAEAEKGTYLAPVAADHDIEFVDVDTLNFDTSPARLGKPAIGSRNQAQSLSGRLIAEGFSCKTALRHSGDETVAPVLDKLFKAAGLKQITEGLAKGYEYDGISDSSTLSVLVTDLTNGSTPAGLAAKGRGAACNLVLEGSSVGEQISATFELNVAYEGEADVVSPIKVLTGEDIGPVEKLLGSNYSFALGDTAFVVHNFSLNLNNTVSGIPDPSKNGGVAYYEVTDTDPVLTVTAQMLSLTDSDVDSLTINDTKLTNVTLSGQYWDIVITDGNLRKADKGEAEGIMTSTLEVEVRAFKILQKELVVEIS